MEISPNLIAFGVSGIFLLIHCIMAAVDAFRMTQLELVDSYKGLFIFSIFLSAFSGTSIFFSIYASFWGKFWSSIVMIIIIAFYVVFSVYTMFVSFIGKYTTNGVVFLTLTVVGCAAEISFYGKAQEQHERIELDRMLPRPLLSDANA